MAVACAAAGLAVTLAVVALGTPAAGEDALARAVQDIGGWFEPVAVAVRWVTTTEVVLLLGAIGVGSLALGGERRRAVCLAVVLVALPIAQSGVKVAVDRERPSAPYVEVRDSWTSPSYPAGHVMSGTLLWGYLAASRAPRAAWRRPWRAVRAVGAAVVLLGLLANVYVGVHWPTDVLGGLLFGGALVAAALALEGVTRGRAVPERPTPPSTGSG